MTLRTPACAFILSLIAFPACGSDTSGSDGSGTGGIGGASGFGGSVPGSGGTVPGSGGTAPGSGGTVPGSGGVSPGSGGSLPGSGGSSTGGTAGASGSAGMAGGGGTAGAAGGGGTAGTAGASGASGSGGESDAGLDSGAEPDASSAPDAADGEADAAVNCTGATTVDVTKDGTVAASSTSFGLNGRYAATRAVDGNATTAWYGGDNRANVTFTWTGTGDDCITQIDTTNTAMVTARPNWGYESVIVEVLSQAGTSLFSKTVSMTGSPDPNLVVDTGGVVGRRVRLSFSGLEAQHMTGGIAELNVKAKR